MQRLWSSTFAQRTAAFRSKSSVYVLRSRRSSGPRRMTLAPRPRTLAAVQIRKLFHFEAAHVLPHHPGKCRRLHGHSYRLEVAVDGPLREDGPARGMVLDFDELATIVRPAILDRLDHASLNDLMPNPT